MKDNKKEGGREEKSSRGWSGCRRSRLRMEREAGHCANKTILKLLRVNARSASKRSQVRVEITPGHHRNEARPGCKISQVKEANKATPSQM